ncbi:MAG: hypothetical protein OXU79_14080 [Gemmatimonadota bacterium]|nr:hypothetical protein [Gemmatimonadota bacterium]
MRALINNLIVLLLLATSTSAGAQTTASSLTEIQRGRVPGSDSLAVSSLYEQFDVDFTRHGLQAGMRAEVFNSWRNTAPGSPLSQVEYQIVHISQKHLRWTRGPVELVAGNYYAILGRGITLRAFDLPGVILESGQYRRRYSPSRDLEGGMATWSGRRAEARALIGRPVLSDVPPAVRVGNPLRDVPRRDNWLFGGEVSLRPNSRIKTGITAVSHHASRLDSTRTWSGFLELDVTPAIEATGLPDAYATVYAEYAGLNDVHVDGSALYLSANAGISNLGLSLEYKDYEKFAFSFNDPPSLVREHAAVLLNRSTHALIADAETGYQVEATYSVFGLGTLTANVSKGKNELAPGFSTTFNERYLGVDVELPPRAGGHSVTSNVFFDWGKDELKGIGMHRIGGVGVESITPGGSVLGFDLQVRRAARQPRNEPEFRDVFTQLSYQHPLGVGAALVLDRTNDPFEVDDGATPDRIETGTRTWLAVNLNVAFLERYEAFVFAGRRRGGAACTSGTCYLVLPFNGLEMRLKTYF